MEAVTDSYAHVRPIIRLLLPNPRFLALNDVYSGQAGPA
jgi:hypothetical protein